MRLEPQSVIGQERPVRRLTKMLEKRSIPHALLFTGADGIGKQKTAKGLGMALNCLSPVGVWACGKCPSCQKVISGCHPDMITVKLEGSFIKIDQVREVSRQLRFAPLEGNWRIVIINDAQAMTLEASNAILKILEEPPKGTVIILTAGQTTDLLSTIVSRCQKIAFRPIPYEKVTKVLMEQKGLDRQMATTLAVAVKGSLGKALSVDAEKWSVWRTNILEQIASLSIKSVQPIFFFADVLARDKDKLVDALDLILTWFRDVIMSKISPERIINKDFMTKIEHASQGETINELLEKVWSVYAAQTAISRNSNPRLVLEVMMMRLCLGCQAVTSQKVRGNFLKRSPLAGN
ncbi:MAG: DNA polymerase III subunit delta' [Desulfobacterales bacterium C00003060]|nr:MAG: DNA polymerase III subunit delta' [Desulfobacterales bacterium S3730MH5]OEU78909.1 MAG: DNA polymerase III subunit delta' [Desulfobacterales bacterium S5133MH4]OEU81470.1 MAG: DNA polymerase III subunit delta' [Desulfobacterales bacterium C00003060]